MLMKMKRRCARPDVRAVVLAGERIHGVLAEITFLRRQRHGVARGLGERDLVEADRAIHVKQNAARVLADGLRLVFRQRDVLVNDLDARSPRCVPFFSFSSDVRMAWWTSSGISADVRRISSSREFCNSLIKLGQRRAFGGGRQRSALRHDVLI